MEECQWGDSWYSVADALRAAAVCRNHREMAIKAFDPSLSCWAELVEELEFRYNVSLHMMSAFGN